MIQNADIPTSRHNGSTIQQASNFLACRVTLVIVEEDYKIKMVDLHYYIYYPLMIYTYLIVQLSSLYHHDAHDTSISASLGMYVIDNGTKIILAAS